MNFSRWSTKKWITVVVVALVCIKFILPSLLAPIKNFFALLGFKLTQGATNTEIGNDTSGLPGGTVNPSNRAQVCLDVANKCQVAIHNFRLNIVGAVIWNFGEDEDEVILQLNRLNNASEARICSANYHAKCMTFNKDRSLKRDVQLYLEANECAQIKAVVYNNLA